MQDGDDTHQQLERNGIEEEIGARTEPDIDEEVIEDANPDQTHRTEGWLEAFDVQLTQELIARVRRFARPRALGVAHAGRKVDDYYVHELVQDAIGHTWEGRVKWDPAKVTLENHLLRVVQFRSKDHRKHATDFPHVALDDQTDASNRAESEASSCVAGNTPHAETYTYKNEVMAQLRKEAARDKPVLRILAAYDAGARTKAEILEYARMSARIYNNAYSRIKRTVRRLTNETLVTKARA